MGGKEGIRERRGDGGWGWRMVRERRGTKEGDLEDLKKKEEMRRKKEDGLRNIYEGGIEWDGDGEENGCQFKEEGERIMRD